MADRLIGQVRAAAANLRTISDEERQQLTELLARKGKTPGAALKTAGCQGADLTTEQYRALVARLEKLPDKHQRHTDRGHRSRQGWRGLSYAIGTE